MKELKQVMKNLASGVTIFFTRYVIIFFCHLLPISFRPLILQQPPK